MNPLTFLRRLFYKKPVAIPGPLGDMLSRERKRVKIALSMPSLDAAGEMQVEQEGYISDIPVEQTLYRTSRGLLLTSSMIAKGVGAGQMMSAATNIEDEEAKELAEHLCLLTSRTDFEEQLLKNIQQELGSRWV